MHKSSVCTSLNSDAEIAAGGCIFLLVMSVFVLAMPHVGIFMNSEHFD